MNDFSPVELIAGKPGADVVFLCDHASNRLPDRYGTLGLPASELERHIAYDIGAAEVTRRLAERFSAPAVMTTFSRLLIDPNRGADDPTLVMQISDGALVPGNAHVGSDEIAHRIDLFWQPYRTAVATAIAEASQDHHTPVVIAIHSFTPRWKAVQRIWEVGVLWDSDSRLALPLIEGLRAERFVVGDNEPYDGALPGDTLDEEVTRHGIAGLLIEVRQDLVADASAAAAIADRIGVVLAPLLVRPELHRKQFTRSRTGRHLP